MEGVDVREREETQMVRLMKKSPQHCLAAPTERWEETTTTRWKVCKPSIRK